MIKISCGDHSTSIAYYTEMSAEQFDDLVRRVAEYARQISQEAQVEATHRRKLVDGEYQPVTPKTEATVTQFKMGLGGKKRVD